MANSKKSSIEVDRFIQSLTQLLVSKKLSQREACRLLEITIGTMTKYLRGEVNPFDVKTRITRNLARELGLTPESLYTFFETGKYKNDLTITDVESWIKSISGTDDLPRILNALSYNQTRASEMKKAYPDTKKEQFVKEAKQKYKKWIMGDDVKRFTKAGANKLAKSIEQLFQEECERRKISKEEAIRDLTPYLQKYFHMEYWGVIIQRLSAGDPIPDSPETMKVIYEAHDKVCPCLATLHAWLCSEGHENCERLQELETYLAEAAVPA